MIVMLRRATRSCGTSCRSRGNSLVVIAAHRVVSVSSVSSLVIVHRRGLRTVLVEYQTGGCRNLARAWATLSGRTITDPIREDLSQQHPDHRPPRTSRNENTNGLAATSATGAAAPWSTGSPALSSVTVPKTTASVPSVTAIPIEPSLLFDLRFVRETKGVELEEMPG
ncbi:hypothetical protein OM076_44305 [Solirubrobacter ginsenosidimutans]|uniref:Uncharacterized protein n=1 Tax=Solirubrobacter ginsenosidimutans TaxID=490573 RepID=A0A9X3N2L9_9ACTN|nr:hypothetical protein [Solirubrobacter ginsenosidimutans]MDA0167364.1 hypothetical protein [Solirubrobacter ginsenosidimutans]